MYKWLLCWRYLRTRYLALVCIISVMLGVATLIVVNSVMGGFSSKLRERLLREHGSAARLAARVEAAQPGARDLLQRPAMLSDAYFLFTPAQVALAWVLAQGRHVVPIPGTKTPKYLADNAGAADVALSAADLADLDALPAPQGTRY